MTTTKTETVELPFVEEAMKRAVSRQIEHPTLSEAALKSLIQESKPLVAGFRINDIGKKLELEDAAIDELKGKWGKYQSAREEMIQSLKERGIEPIAVLTKVAWDRIWKTAGLYALSINSDGQIGVSANALIDKVRGNTDRIYMASFIAAASVVWGISVALVYGYAPVDSLSAVAYGFVLAVACACFGAIALDTYALDRSIISWIEKKKIVKFAKTISWDDALKHLMPDQESLYQGLGTPAKVILPDPPKDVEAILIKAQGLPLQTVVDPDMFGFVGGVEGILLNKQQEVAEERRWLKALARDPIIVWEESGVVAIIAQFGESPIEKRVVELVMGQNDLI